MSVTIAKVGKTKKEIEKKRNMDKLDIKPGLQFMKKYQKYFFNGLNNFLNTKISSFSEEKVDKLEIINAEKVTFIGINLETIKFVLKHIPETLWKMSDLKTLDLTFADQVPIPGYDARGNFNQKKVRWISSDEFDVKKYSTRILIGYSNGENLYMTPIPSSIETDKNTVMFYQLYVLLHEFFHSIEMRKRSEEKRKKILFSNSKRQFTFDDWWQEFENLLLTKKEKCISRYASTYSHQINSKIKEKKYDIFTHAVAENIADCFAAYVLNILPNDDDWTNFKGESFGDREMCIKYHKENSLAANSKWLLINELFHSKVIQ